MCFQKLFNQNKIIAHFICCFCCTAYIIIYPFISFLGITLFVSKGALVANLNMFFICVFGVLQQK